MELHDAPDQQTRVRHRRGSDSGFRRTGNDHTDHDHAAGHGHGPATPVDRRVRLAIMALLAPCALATVIGLLVLFPSQRSGSEAAAALRLAGHVTAAVETPCNDDSTSGTCLALTVRMTEGPLAGQDVVTLESVLRGKADFGTGDDVMLVAGQDPADATAYQIVDFQRGTPMLGLALLFATAVVALGRWRGAAALTALGVTAVVLALFVLPAILAGRDPLAVAVVGSCAIMFAALYLTHGVTARTSAALLGTLANLLLIGLFGAAFAAATRLTGADEDTANLAATLGTPIDGRGLVLAGLVIGALGALDALDALDDVTVTQASAVWELRAADPQRSSGQRPGVPALRLAGDLCSRRRPGRAPRRTLRAARGTSTRMSRPVASFFGRWPATRSAVPSNDTSTSSWPSRIVTG